MDPELHDLLSTIRDELKALRESMGRSRLPESLRLYTMAEVADILHLSEASVRRLVRLGMLRPLYVGPSSDKGAPRFASTEVRRFIESRSPPPPPPPTTEKPKKMLRIPVDLL